MQDNSNYLSSEKKSELENRLYADLSMDHSSEQMQKNEEEILFMQNFIQQKFSQVNDLQKHFIQELQFIQTSKNKQKEIEKMIKQTLIPITNELQSVLGRVKSLFQPFRDLTANYVGIVTEKSKDLLFLKQLEIQKQQEQLEKCKKQNKKLQEELNLIKIRKSIIQTEDVPKSPRKNQETDEILFNRTKKIEKEFKIAQLPTLKQDTSLQRLKKNPYMLQQEHKESKERSPLRLMSNNRCSRLKQELKVSNLSKNQQSYGNTLLNKTTNISYRCQRPAQIKRTTPSRSAEKNLSHNKSSKILETEPQQTRKDYIKQKIQSLKQKNQNISKNDRITRLK